MSHTALITREPVINQHRRITANRLIVHADSVEQAVSSLDGLADVWPEQHMVSVSLHHLLPDRALLEWLVPANTMLEIPTAALGYPEVQALLPELAGQNFQFNLSWYQGQALPPELAWRFVLVDARHDPLPLDPPGLTLAWGLPDLQAFDAAIEKGYTGASGWFFLDGLPLASTLAPSQHQIIQVLNLIRKNAEIREIEALLKQDVALSYKLLRYINGACFGLRCEIQSFRHALTILGYDKLWKWLSMLLVSASRDSSAAALMQTSIVRGRFMENIAASFFPADELDNLFITGAFSLLDLLLGTDMPKALSRMQLPGPVHETLLGQNGIYTPFLQLAGALEAQSKLGLQEAAAELHLTADQINRAHLEALCFAGTLQVS